MPAPEEKIETKPEQLQEQPIRELTQTDHLNKQLLMSLLNRMEEGTNPALAKMLEPDNQEENNDEWKD